MCKSLKRGLANLEQGLMPAVGSSGQSRKKLGRPRKHPKYEKPKGVHRSKSH